MRFAMIFSFVVMLCFNVQAAQKALGANESMAKMTAEFVNRVVTVDAYLNVLARHISSEQMEKLKKEMAINNLSLKTKFPKMNYDGNKVYFDKKNYIMYVDEETINVNGIEIKRSQQTVDVVFHEVIEKLKKREATGIFWVPKVYALGLMGIMLGAIAIGGIAKLLAPMFGMDGNQGAMLAGGLFAASQMQNGIRGGTVYCNGSLYAYGVPRPSGYFGPGTPIMGPLSLGRVFGQTIPPCNPYNAGLVYRGINNFGLNATPLQRVTPPGTVLGPATPLVK
ncbi:MAG: hypothetical protein H6623_07070 [Bdellovibrionaceae bacterium]|nr:hypothetical protein [Pseudobdellovibrionaceae bacterium]